MTTKEQNKRTQVLSVINRLNRRVTIPDVVAETGLSLDTVSNTLNELAHELQANLDVTERGLIYYRFPDNLQYRLYSSSLQRIANRAWVVLKPFLGFMFRISFGLLLLCSVAIVYFVMFLMQVIIAGVSGQASTVWESIKDLYRTFSKLRLVKRAALPFLSKDVGEETGAARDRGFLLNCYYFLFGPGDPNHDFEAEQSRLIARLIQKNNGLLTPDQLAPVMGTPPDEPEKFFAVLSKFNGMPVTTPSGHLVYVFSDFQSRFLTQNEKPFEDDAWTRSNETTEAEDAAPVEDQLPVGLEKRKWVFAGIGKEAILQTLLLAAVNFFGTLFFWYMLFAIRSSDTGTEQMFFLLWIYAGFFLLFPAGRWVYVQLKNIEIKKYNRTIDKFAQSLINSNENPELALKLKEAEEMRQEESAGLVDRLVYTTRRDNLDQEADVLIELDGEPRNRGVR